MKDLATEHSKKNHKNRRDAEVYTDVGINIYIKPYVFDNKIGTRLSKHSIVQSVLPKYCPLCGKKVHGYQDALTKGGLVKV